MIRNLKELLYIENKMQIINTPNLAEARKQIEKAKKEGKEVIVLAQDPEFNRKILENRNVDIFLSPESHKRKDSLKERDSGLNEILCRIAVKNNIKIGVNIEELKNKDKKEKAILLARIKQNIMLCKKTGAELIVLGNYDKKDMFSLLLTLGCSTSQAKKAIAA